MPWPLAKTLRSILEQDLVHDKLVIGGARAFQILREHYAHELGVARITVASNGRSLFEEFEAKLRQRRAEQIKGWLRTQMKAGTLPLRNGVIEHKWLQSNLKLSDRQLYDCVEIATVVREVNELIKSAGYVPSARDDILRRLKKTLASDCPLAKGLLRISASELAQRVGTTPGVLKQSPYLELIRAKAGELQSGKHLPPMVAFYKRAWDFRDLRPVFPTNFVVELARRFELACEGLAECRAAFKGIKDLLRWVANSSAGSCKRSFQSIQRGLPPSDVDWEDAVHDYASHRSSDATSKQLPSIRTALSSLNNLLNRIAQSGLLPALTSPPNAGKNATKKGMRIPTIAQSTRNGGTSRSKKSELLEFARVTLKLASTEYESHVEEDETLAFLAVIKDEAEHINLTPETSLSSAVLSILDRRLGQIMAAATARYKAAKAKLEEGQRLLKMATLPSDFYPNFARGHSGKQARHFVMRRYFPEPASQASIELATANMLAIADRKTKMLFPSDRDFKVKDAVGQFFQKRYMELGGRSYLQDLLTPSADAQACVLTMFLIASGTNLAVAHTLPVECESRSEAPGHVRITGIKDRAKGKPIFADLRSHSDTVEAIRWVVKYAKPLRELAEAETSTRLFVRVYGDRVKDLGASWFNTWFAQFTRSIDDLKDCRIVPSMIRPSVLVKATLERRGGAQVSQAIGQHGLNEAQGYQGKLPVVLERTDDIRGFQSHYETVNLRLASNGQPLLCIGSERLAQRVEQLIPTGLAALCEQSDGGSDPNSEHLVLELNSDVAYTLQAWKAGLLKAQPEWERERLETWTRDWLPFLSLISIVEDQCVTGSLLGLWDEAADRLNDNLSISENFKLPCPFVIC